MKRSILSFIVFFSVFLLTNVQLFSAETLEISFDPSWAGGIYGNFIGPTTCYCIAVWLEDSSGNFVRTLDRSAGIRWHSLREWEAQSGFDLDGVSGATVINDGAYVYTTYYINNDTPSDISMLPDGIYTVKVELSDRDGPLPGETNVGTFSFNKNGSASLQSGLSNGGFSNLNIDYSGRSGGSYPPGVFAGTNQYVPLATGATLNGAVNDPDTVSPTITWAKDSGPGTVAFADNTSPSTTVTFSVDGVYVLSLTAQDPQANVTIDYVTVYVNAVMISAQEDVAVVEINPDNNYDNGDIRIRVYNYSSGSGKDSEGFIKFDLSNTYIPTAAEVTSAKLRLAPNDGFELSNRTRQVNGISGNSSWNDSLLTWNSSRTLADFPGLYIGQFTTNNDLFSGFGWVEATDSASFIHDEHETGYSATSFRVYRQIQANLDFFRFCNEETSTPPKLLVTYNYHPTAVIGADQTSGNFPLTVNFNSTGTTDDGKIAMYEWDFDYDGSFTIDDSGTALSATSHEYTVPGGYTAALRVRDERGAEDIDTVAINVIDPASPGTIQFSSAAYNANENAGSVIITVTRIAGSFAQVTADYATSNGTAIAGDDYTAVSGTVTFNDGVITDQTFIIDITNDSTAEANETINLTLSNPQGGATLGAPNSAVLTIINDDSGGGSSSGNGTKGGCVMGNGSYSSILLFIILSALLVMTGKSIMHKKQP